MKKTKLNEVSCFKIFRFSFFQLTLLLFTGLFVLSNTVNARLNYQDQQEEF